MRRKGNRPDLLFVLAIAVMAGVLATATVSASQDVTEPQGWQMDVKANSGCEQGLGTWPSCSHWRNAEPDASLSSQGVSLELFHNQFPELGVVWYFRQQFHKNYNINNDIDLFSSGAAAVGLGSNQHFGMALRQQYQQFGLQLGFETDYASDQQLDTRLYLGIINRW